MTDTQAMKIKSVFVISVDIRWRTHADVFMEDETHAGDDVAVFATGPYHHMFSGLYEQSQIAMIMAYAACIGPGLHACNAAVYHQLTFPLYLMVFVVLFRTLYR